MVFSLKKHGSGSKTTICSAWRHLGMTNPLFVSLLASCQMQGIEPVGYSQSHGGSLCFRIESDASRLPSFFSILPVALGNEPKQMERLPVLSRYLVRAVDRGRQGKFQRRRMVARPQKVSPLQVGEWLSPISLPRSAALLLQIVPLE